MQSVPSKKSGNSPVRSGETVNFGIGEGLVVR